jgi:hypothetical protein
LDNQNKKKYTKEMILKHLSLLIYL